jgi:hypothetical protein
MAIASRQLLAAGVAALAALASAACAVACGSGGYSYAGLSAQNPGYGISAEITSLVDFDILNGHVGAWVGVGGPGEGPGGTDEWLQVGLSGFAQVTGSDAYYEVARPHHYPVYHQLAGGLAGREDRDGRGARDPPPAELVARLAGGSARLSADLAA